MYIASCVLFVVRYRTQTQKRFQVSDVIYKSVKHRDSGCNKGLTPTLHEYFYLFMYSIRKTVVFTATMLDT